MSLEQLRKHLKELKEKGLLGSGYTAPELPGMGEPYEPMEQSPAEPYQAPESLVPDVQTQRATPSVSAKINDIAKKTTATATSGNKNNQTKVDPKTRENGSKTMVDITVDRPEYAKEGIANSGLIDAYNAGLNNEDMSREARNNAAAGGYLGQIEAMYNAGRQDAGVSTDITTGNTPSISTTEKDSNTQFGIDNLGNLSYTPSKTTGNTNAEKNTSNVTVPNMGAAPNADTLGSGNNSNNNNTASYNNSTKPYQISDLEKELNYMMDMLFMNGAGSSADPSARMAYEYVSNPDNKGKAIPQEVYDAYYGFMGGVDNDQIARSNQIAVGKDDEIGLVGEIYKNKPKTTTNPEVKPVAPVSTSLGDYVTSAGKDDQESYNWGQTGKFALGETLKQNPDIFGTRSGLLYEAYQAGLKGVDLSQALKDNAAEGNILDQIEKMYRAGETDAKIAAGNAITVPDFGAPQYGEVIIPDLGQGDTERKETSVIDPSMGKAGNKILNELSEENPSVFFKNNSDMIAAYNAGLMGTDISKEAKDNAKAGGYSDAIWSMYEAGEADSKMGSGNTELDRTENLNYAKALWEPHFNYYNQMLDLLGAGSSEDANENKAYEYFKNSSNKGKEIPKEIKDAFYDYVKGLDEDQKIRAYEITRGIDLKGLCDNDIISMGSYAGKKVSQGFNDETTKTHFGHLGYDITGLDKSDLNPILPGRVVEVVNSDDSPNGRVITIEHQSPDGTFFYSSYCHLYNIYVKVGDEVGINDAIGQMGHSGKVGEGKGLRENPKIDVHVHVAVYTGKPSSSPIGYTMDINNGDYETFENTPNCKYNSYYCIAPRDSKRTFFDLYAIILTNGEIIDLFF